MRVLGMPGSVVIKQSDSSEEDPEKNFTSQSHVLIAWKITISDFFWSLYSLSSRCLLKTKRTQQGLPCLALDEELY